MNNIDKSLWGDLARFMHLYYGRWSRASSITKEKVSVWLFLSHSWAACFIKPLSTCINPNWLLRIHFLPLDLLWKLENIPTWIWISVASLIHSVSKLTENNYSTIAITDLLIAYWKPKHRVSCCNLMFNGANPIKQDESWWDIEHKNS